MNHASAVRDTPGERTMQALEAEIAELAAHIHAATCRLLQLIHEFDRNRGWEGWKTCAQWLSWRTGIGLDAAREKLRVARALPALPKITAAFEKGELSYSKVRALTRIATEENEEFLLSIAFHGTTSHVEKVVRGYRRADPEREVAQANRQHEARYLRTRQDEHGNLVIEGRLPPELGARITKALDASMDALFQSERADASPRVDSDAQKEDETEVDGDAEEEDENQRLNAAAERGTYGQRRADALVLLADSALAAGLPGRRAADTHQIVVHVDADVLADPAADGRSELETGENLSAESSRRLACDASVIPLLEDSEGNPLSVGRRRRTVPPSIRRALASREPGCQFPGCHHTRFLEAHHIEHWADGGETKLANLVHTCSFHHRQLHEGGFRVERTEEGALKFLTRYGVEIVAAPAPPRSGSPGELFRDQEALDIQAGQLPVWRGDRMDSGFAVSALLWRDGRRIPPGHHEDEPWLRQDDGELRSGEQGNDPRPGDDGEEPAPGEETS
jgi:hypothetical protein